MTPHFVLLWKNDWKMHNDNVLYGCFVEDGAFVFVNLYIRIRISLSVGLTRNHAK